jgi:hypothetical protein
LTVSSSNLPAAPISLAPGAAVTYTVTGTLSASFTGSLTNTVTATPASGAPISAADPDSTVAPSISGFVYADTNLNGVFDRNAAGVPTEIGLPNVTVILSGPSGRYSTITAPDGSYTFQNLTAPGTYRVSIMQPAGFVADTRNQVGVVLPGNHPDGTAGANQFSNISLQAGQQGIDYNFGENRSADQTDVLIVDQSSASDVLPARRQQRDGQRLGQRGRQHDPLPFHRDREQRRAASLLAIDLRHDHHQQSGRSGNRHAQCHGLRAKCRPDSRFRKLACGHRLRERRIPLVSSGTAATLTSPSGQAVTVSGFDTIDAQSPDAGTETSKARSISFSLDLAGNWTSI